MSIGAGLRLVDHTLHNRGYARARENFTEEDMIGLLALLHDQEKFMIEVVALAKTRCGPDFKPERKDLSYISNPGIADFIYDLHQQEFNMPRPREASP